MTATTSNLESTLPSQPQSQSLASPSVPVATSETARSMLASKLKDSGTPISSSLSSSSSSLQSQSQPQGQPQPPLPHYSAPNPLSGSSLASHKFQLARKRIISPQSLQVFQSSKAFEDILGLTIALNDSVKGKKLGEETVESEVTRSVLAVLSDISKLVDETPAAPNSSSRFGNPAFRDLYRKIKGKSREYHQSIPGLQDIKGTNEGCDAIEEIQVYFEESWGNEERIDYGSGMELNFLCWILCLVRLSLLSLETDGPVIVLRIFWQYIQVMRKIQSTYWLEPAGSHGVWGLDDYHFLPFIFGSSQLSLHRHLRPKSIHDAEILEEFSSQYMYLACIQFINSIKTASLRWHSPMLDDISSVKTWSKVNEGMLKMYKAEVLSKLPIAQHVFFGSLLEFPQDEDTQAQVEESQVDSCGHVHSHTPAANIDGAAPAPTGQAAGWGDCCGIPIPSAFAAAQDEKAKHEQFRIGSGAANGVRRVPFD
ncbi:unnamed protein product [Sympodiomycopsis kandeliae]